MAKRILSLVLAVLMTAALCACGGGESTEAPAATNTEVSTGSTGEKLYGGELTVGISADLDSSLDPHVSSASAGTREVLFNIFEGLMKPDSEGNLIPAVAEDYTVNETADEYTFLLREGVTFHNGETVTVGDVVYSLKRAAGLETGEILVDTLSGIASVEAADDRTVVITLSAPDVEFLAYTTVAIIPEGNEPTQEMIGTGPFKYISRTIQDSIVLEKFADYWGEGAYVDKVTLKVIEDGQTLVMSLQSGAIDMAIHLSATQVAELGGLNVLEGSMNLVQALYLNHNVEPFNDVRVRQALCYILDKQMIIELAGAGHGTALGSGVYPAFGKFYNDETTNYYETNLEKAQQLLTEAGYPDGFSFTITVPTNYTPHVETGEVMVELLRQAGIDVTLEPVEWATWLADVYQGRNFDATITGLVASTLAASSLLERYTSDSAKNFIAYESEAYDAAYEKAVTTVDEAAQIEAFKECQLILAQEAASVYIQDLAEFVAMQADVGGYEFYPLYVMDLATIYRIG